MLRHMENTSVRKHQTVVKDWRSGCSILQKLDKLCDNEPENSNLSLYDSVRKQLGLRLISASILEHKQELIEHYHDENFAKVSLLLDDAKKRHITDFDFNVVVYELVDAKNQVSDNVSSTDGDQIAHNIERSRRVQKSLKLQDIFAKRRQKPSGPEEEVNRVLLLGNPGTGKTSLSKRLCNEWATGKWGQAFDRVYLLPIRQLTQSRLKSEKTLKAAIAVLLFNAAHKSADERIALHRRMKDELDERTTLLVLDGLDEANGNEMAEEIVKNAVSRSCCILVLSKPHNLGDLRLKMDVQVECLGLTADQLKAYIRKEVPDTAEDLIYFVSRSPIVWDIAQVPVSAQILCTFWNSEEGKLLKKSTSLSLKSLYSSMTEYAWQRFVEKTGENADRRAMFSSLEIIAFKSISQSKIEIPYDLVLKHAQGATTLKLLRDSGFLLFYMEGQVFQFAHLSFHEFFAGKFLAKNLRGTEKQSKKAKQYIADRKYYDTNRVTLSFMTQCYCQEEDDDDDKDCVENLKQLLSILDDSPVEVVGFQHLLLKMRTLDAFLSVCGSCAEDIRSDDDLQRVIQFATTALGRWAGWQLPEPYLNFDLTDPALLDEIFEDLIQMPSLFVNLPELLKTVLKHGLIRWARKDTSRIGRLASYAPEQLLEMMPTKEIPEGLSLRSHNEPLLSWLEVFAKSGPECAVLALEPLKTACRDQNKMNRTAAFVAVSHFLKLFPEREDLHSLCLDAMKDTSAGVRASFLRALSFVTFKPKSVAADLAWALTVEATRDEDDKVRSEAYMRVVRKDQTSKASIKKMLELTLGYLPMCVDRDPNDRKSILKSIDKLLRRFPKKLTVFLPYLATCCNDSSYYVVAEVMVVIQNLFLFVPTPQKRELGEMISRIYCNVEKPDSRKELVTVLYDIGQQIPHFMTDFPDVFFQGCRDTDNRVSELAKARETVTGITSAGSVDAINKVFWDQSLRVKTGLLRQIQQESMINEETAEMVLEMAAHCLKSNGIAIKHQCLNVLSSLTRFRSLSSKVLQRILDGTCGNNYSEAEGFLFDQPVTILLKYFWDTSDKSVLRMIADKHMLASVTHQTARGGKTIVSIMERGKNTQQEVPTELAEKLISLVKLDLSKFYGDLLL